MCSSLFFGIRGFVCVGGNRFFLIHGNADSDRCYGSQDSRAGNDHRERTRAENRAAVLGEAFGSCNAHEHNFISIAKRGIAKISAIDRERIRANRKIAGVCYDRGIRFIVAERAVFEITVIGMIVGVQNVSLVIRKGSIRNI